MSCNYGIKSLICHPDRERHLLCRTQKNGEELTRFLILFNLAVVNEQDRQPIGAAETGGGKGPPPLDPSGFGLKVSSRMSSVGILVVSITDLQRERKDVTVLDLLLFMM